LLKTQVDEIDDWSKLSRVLLPEEVDLPVYA